MGKLLNVHTGSYSAGLCVDKIEAEVMAAEDEGRAFRDVMGRFATGIVVATGVLDGVPAGFAAQSFLSLSLDPPLVALSPARTSTSWPKLRDSGSFCINILAADQKPICDTFAQSGIEKFSEFEWHPGVTGSPVLAGVLAYIDCDLEAEYDAGDHTIAIGRVRDLAIVEPDGEPLLFLRGGYGRFQTL
jgi:flavin reductase (DIM6/NTAB) family NADH-FMN oxidoreductase RutF